MLKQLIQYTELNKKWIEGQSSLQSSIVREAPKQEGHLPNRYRELVEETGIVQRLKNKSASEKRCLENRLDECGGTLSRSSSKKHPHVYLDAEDKSIMGSGGKIQCFARRCMDDDESKETLIPLTSVGKLLEAPKKDCLEAFVDEVISEEAPSERGTPKPEQDSSWRRLSLDNLNSSQEEDLFTTPVTK